MSGSLTLHDQPHGAWASCANWVNNTYYYKDCPWRLKRTYMHGPLLSAAQTRKVHECRLWDYRDVPTLCNHPHASHSPCSQKSLLQGTAKEPADWPVRAPGYQVSCCLQWMALTPARRRSKPIGHLGQSLPFKSQYKLLWHLCLRTLIILVLFFWFLAS